MTTMASQGSRLGPAGLEDWPGGHAAGEEKRPAAPAAAASPNFAAGVPG